MDEISKQQMVNELQIIPLSPDVVRAYKEEICMALNQIPKVEPHTIDYLLMEKKRERILHRKWDHSLILLDGDKFVGIAIGYEREAEGNTQYPKPSIYLNDLAVAKRYQQKGIGRSLVEQWFDRNTKLGFLALNGKLRFAVQTNSADWNQHVQKLYESFGFKKMAEKHYDNRTDNVYVLEP